MAAHKKSADNWHLFITGLALSIIPPFISKLMIDWSAEISIPLSTGMIEFVSISFSSLILYFCIAVQIKTTWHKTIEDFALCTIILIAFSSMQLFFGVSYLILVSHLSFALGLTIHTIGYHQINKKESSPNS